MFNQQNYQGICELAKDLKPVSDTSKPTACCLSSRSNFVPIGEKCQLDACGVPVQFYAVKESSRDGSTFEEIRYDCSKSWMSLILGG